MSLKIRNNKNKRNNKKEPTKLEKLERNLNFAAIKKQILRRPNSINGESRLRELARKQRQ